MKECVFQNACYSACLREDGTLKSLTGAQLDVNLLDERSAFGAACYTLPTDDIATKEKPPMTPWADRTALWSAVSWEEQGAQLSNSLAAVTYSFLEDHIHIAFSAKPGKSSQLGLNMPFHFLGKKGGDYKTQLIPTTPYRSEVLGLSYWFLDSPQGQPLLVLAKGAAAWKIDYSPYSHGHFIVNLKWLLNLDRVYGKTPAGTSMEVDIFFPRDFDDALAILNNHTGLPVTTAQAYCAGIGAPLTVEITGNATHCTLKKGGKEYGAVPVADRVCQLRLPEAGIYEITPIAGETPGLSCTVGAIEAYADLFHKNIQSLRAPYHCDRGLCEGGVWAQAAILHQRLVGFDPEAQAQIDAQMQDILTEKIPRCSVPDRETDGWPAYHVYGFARTQEGFFGVSLFVEAYRTYREPKYLEYAVNMLGCLEKYYIEPSGRILSRRGGEAVDYSTVTTPLLSLIDLVGLLREEGDSRAEEFAALAEKVADFIVSRGFDFPTETKITEFTEAEMEDGSISCSALSVLYTAYWIKNKPEYLDFAKKVLRLHDAWCMQTPDVRMNASSLRWWETLWEGDRDGPAICAGHAWSLWRAEADFYYGLLTGDAVAFLRSYNGFATNLSKIQPDGTSYACYHPDAIRGGGSRKRSEEVDLRLKEGYPETEDQSLSKYLWVRLEKTWWNTCVVYEKGGKVQALNAEIVGFTDTQIQLRETVTPLRNLINLTDRKISPYRAASFPK